MIVRINEKVEKALRVAMGHVAHAEAEQIEPALALLDDAERAEALALAIMVASYVVVDVCGAKWPNDAAVRQIAEALATAGTTAKRLHLEAEQIYAYLSRAVFGRERLEDVISDEPMITRLPVIVAQRAAVVYSPQEMDTWDYLDRIESAIEVAAALDASVLPAAVMLAYVPQPEGAGQE